MTRKKSAKDQELARHIKTAIRNAKANMRTFDAETRRAVIKEFDSLSAKERDTLAQEGLALLAREAQRLRKK